MTKNIVWNALKAAANARGVAVPAKWADKKEVMEQALAALTTQVAQVEQVAPVAQVAQVAPVAQVAQVAPIVSTPASPRDIALEAISKRDAAIVAAANAANDSAIIARRNGRVDLRTLKVEPCEYVSIAPYGRDMKVTNTMPEAQFNALINGMLTRYHKRNPKFNDNQSIIDMLLEYAENFVDSRNDYIAAEKAAADAARERALAESASASKSPELVREQGKLVKQLAAGNTDAQATFDANRAKLLGYSTTAYPAPAKKQLPMAHKRYQYLEPAAAAVDPFEGIIVRHETDFNAFYGFGNINAFLRDVANLTAPNHSFHEILRARHRDEAEAINLVASQATLSKEYRAAQMDLDDLREEMKEQEEYEEIDENYIDNLSIRITLAEDRLNAMAEDAAIAAHKKIAIDQADFRALILDIDGAGIGATDEAATIAVFEAAYRDEFTERYLRNPAYEQLFLHGCVAANPRAQLVPGLDYIVINNSGLCHSKPNTPYKFSIGIRSGNYVTTPAESKLFAEGVRMRLPEHLQPLVDMQVYTKDHGFRLPFQTKAGDARYSRPIGCPDAPFNHLVMGAHHKPLAVRLPLISPPTYDEFRTKTARINYVDDATLRRASEILTPHVPRGFSLFKCSGSMLEYRRDRNTPGIHCKICDRAHDNENFFYGLIQHNGNVVHGCYIYTRYYKDINRRIDSGEAMPAHLSERLHNKFITVGSVPIEAAMPVVAADALPAGPLPTFEEFMMKTRLQREFDMMESVCKAPLRHRRIAPKAAEHYILENTPEVSPLPLCKTLLVQASMGGGKTQSLIRLINENFMRAVVDLVAQKFSGKNQVIIALSHRESFATEIAARLQGFVSYKSVTENDIDTSKHPRVVVQMESLHRLSTTLVPDLLIVDESESIFEQICSPLFRKGRQARLVLKALLDNSLHVVCMDANMSHDTQHLISGRGPFTLVRNTFVRNPLRARCTLSKELWMIGLMADLSAGKKIVIPSNSLTAAKMIVDAISLKLPQLKVRLYSGETDAAQKAAEIAQVNTEWLKYDVVIYTPTITAGVSFTAAHFDKIYCWFGTGSCAVDCCNQMTQRVRNVADKEMVLFIGHNTGHRMTRQDVVNAIANDRNCLYSTHSGAAELGQLHAAKYTPTSQFYHEVAVRNIMRANRSDVGFHWEMVNCLKLAGHSVETIANNILINDCLDANTEMFEGIATVKADKFAAIAAAHVINDEEAKKLAESRVQLSQEQAKALEKHAICQTYGIAPEQVTADICENGTLVHRKKYRHLQQAINGLDAIKYLCEDKLKLATEGDELFMELPYRKHAHALSLLKAFGYKGVMDEGTLKKAVLQPAIESLREQLMRDHEEIATMYGIRCKRLTKHSDMASTLEYINAIFDSMYGIRITTSTRTKAGRDDYKIYRSRLCKIATTLTH